MADKQIVRDISFVVKLVGYFCCAPVITASLRLHPTIAVLPERTKPRPTFIRPALVNVCPEAFDRVRRVCNQDGLPQRSLRRGSSLRYQRGGDPNILSENWCRDQGSHLDFAAFNGARGLPLLPRQNGCEGRSCTDATLLMRQRGNCSSSHNLVGALGYDPSRSSPSGRSPGFIRPRRSPELTPRKWSIRRVPPSVPLVGNEKF